MARTRILLIVYISFTFLTASAMTVVLALQVEDGPELSLQRLKEACAKSVDHWGLGHAQIDGGTISGEVSNFNRPCALRLVPGTTLTLDRVTLHTSNLLIEDGGDSNEAVHIKINKSRLSSVDGGFQISFKSNRSSVDITQSQFSYPLSVGLAVGLKDDDLAARIEVSQSIFSSVSPKSEGITISSTGQTTVIDSQFNLNEPGDIALLVGQNCLLTKNTNANDSCHIP